MHIQIFLPRRYTKLALLLPYKTRGGSRIPCRSGADPLGGRLHTILSNFPKNCMKLRKFWAVGGRGGRAPGAPPLGSATENITYIRVQIYKCARHGFSTRSLYQHRPVDLVSLKQEVVRVSIVIVIITIILPTLMTDFQCKNYFCQTNITFNTHCRKYFGRRVSLLIESILIKK